MKRHLILQVDFLVGMKLLELVRDTLQIDFLKGQRVLTTPDTDLKAHIQVDIEMKVQDMNLDIEMKAQDKSLDIEMKVQDMSLDTEMKARDMIIDQMTEVNQENDLMGLDLVHETENRKIGTKREKVTTKIADVPR